MCTSFVPIISLVNAGRRGRPMLHPARRGCV